MDCHTDCHRSEQAGSGLQESSGSSTAYYRVLCLQLRSGGSSSRCAAVGPSGGWWNDNRNDIAGCSTRLITYLLHRMGRAVAVRALCHHAWMTFDQSWLDRTSAWWAKADRAHNHLRSLDQLVAKFRASEPYTVVPRPTDIPGRTEYRLHIHKPMPPEISTTIGDILHNLRSALDSLAHEIALRGLDRPLTAKEERACVFQSGTRRSNSISSSTRSSGVSASRSAPRSTEPRPAPRSGPSSPSASMRKRSSLASRSPTPTTRSTAGVSCTG